MEIETNLTKIKNELDKDHMSCFIGAGFSKNAISTFPDWNQLLYPMISEMYKDLIENKKNIRKKNKKAINMEDIYNEIIAEKGTLKIPEDYVHYKNRREALDVYIENSISQHNIVPKIKLNTHEKLLKINWQDIVTTNWDTLLEQANETLPQFERYHSVLDAKELITQSKKRIIKIHGSIKESYPFDNSYQQKYVVSELDFKNYHEEHEDFSNFMRVKILENSFCLIGFSGADPNFQYWVKLLRKTVTKGGKTKAPNNIFLISHSKACDCSKEDKTFFKNNYITCLFIDEIETFLKSENKYNNSLNVYENLFLYLNDKNINSISVYNSISYPFDFNLIKNKSFVIEMLKNTGTWNKEEFLFLYNYIFNNYFSLEDIIQEDKIANLEKTYLSLLSDTFHPSFYKFGELLLKYYRDKSKNKEFNDLYIKLKESSNINLLDIEYQKCLFLFESLEYTELKKLTKSMISLIDKNTPSETILHVLKTLTLLEGDNYLDPELYSRYKDFINIGIRNSENKQTLFFLEIWNFYISTKYPNIDNIANAHKNISFLIEDCKKIEDYQELFGDDIKRIINFIEYTGLPITNIIEDSKIEKYSEEPDKSLTNKLFLHLISKYGNSSNEDLLNKITPYFLRKFSEEDKNLYLTKFIDIVKYKINNFNEKKDEPLNFNPKVYIFLISIIITYMDDKSRALEFINFFFTKLKEGNIFISSGVIKGDVYGWKKPVMNFASLIRNKELLLWYGIYIFKNYNTDMKIIWKNRTLIEKTTNYISKSEFYDYIYNLFYSDNFEMIKDSLFKNEDIIKILKNDFLKNKKLCFLCYENLPIDIQKKCKLYLEKNYNKTINPYFLKYISPEKAKNRIIKSICEIEKRDLGQYFNWLEFTIIQISQNYICFFNKEEKEIIYNHICDIFDNEITNIFPFYVLIFGEIKSETYNKLLNKYNEINKDLLKIEWVYTSDKELFVKNVNNLLIYGSYISDNSSIKDIVLLCFNRLLYEDSKEFQSVIRAYCETKDIIYLKYLYTVPQLKLIINALKEKYSKKIPLCYDYLFIKNNFLKGIELPSYE